METVKVSDLHSGQKFTATINGTSSMGVIHIDENEKHDYIYLCQNEMDGASGFDRHGYNYSWAVVVSEGEVRLERGDVHDFSVTDVTVKNPEYIEPAFIFPGTPFKGSVRDINVEGVLHSDGENVWICFNKEGMEAGNNSPMMHGYTNSYYIRSSNDRSSGLIFFPSRQITVTEYSPHPAIMEYCKKAQEIRSTLVKDRETLEAKESSLERLKEETIAYTKKKMRPKTGFGHNIHYNDNDEIIAFGCGEVSVTRAEVEAFLKITTALSSRGFTQEREIEKAIELSKRIIGR